MSQLTQVRAVLVACSTNNQGTCAACLPLAGKCSLDYWLETLQGCPRLQPLSEKVLLVGDVSHQQQIKSWAASAGLPSSCIVTTSSSCTGLVQGLSAAVAACPSLAESYVLAANASFVLEPGTSLSRLVEAAVVRGKDIVTCTVPFEGADMSQLVQVRKEDPVAANSRANIELGAEAHADAWDNSILGPAVVLSPSSLCSLTQGAAAAAGDGLRDLGLFLQLQQQQGRGVYSVDLPLFFSLDPEDFALTDAFFGHYRELQRIAMREAQQMAVGVNGASAACITGTLDSLMSRLQTLGAGLPPSPVRQQLMATVSAGSSSGSRGSTRSSAGSLAGSGSGSAAAGKSGSGAVTSSSNSSSLKHMFAQFAAKYQHQLENEAKAPVDHDYTTLPCRFEHPEGWDNRPKKQHPCYTTSSNNYGVKPPTDFDMPLVWTGIHGKFTNTFNGGCYRSMGLKTSVERSRVHRELDYL